jgi:tetratricopeptide (TPR) repeat protein
MSSIECQGVSLKNCEALKYKYMGNTFLEEGKIVSAIDAYQKALDRCDNNPKQRGVVLLLRASAYLQQAQTHQQILQKAVREWKLPQQPLLKAMLEDAIALSDTIKSSKKNSNTASISLDIMDKLASNGSLRTAQLRKIQYRHGLYQNSLLQAARDSLEATELLPNYLLSHKTAGECLVELWRIREARQYYEKAKRIMDKQQRSRDESNRSRASVEKSTASVMDGTDGEIGSDDNSKKKYDDSSNMDEIFRTLDIRQSILEEALNNPDWSIDSVRLALDVAV